MKAREHPGTQRHRCTARSVRVELFRANVNVRSVAQDFQVVLSLADNHEQPGFSNRAQ